MTLEENNETRWYVMRVYKNEKKAEAMLTYDGSLRYFIPKKKVLRLRHGKKTVCLEPVIPSLVFVYASYQHILQFKHSCYGDLQFVTWKIEDRCHYLTVNDKEMDNFIRICEQRESETCFYKPEEIHINKGTKVRVHGGAFDNVEGIFVKVKGKRARQLVVLLTGVMAVSTTVDPDYLEIIE